MWLLSMHLENTARHRETSRPVLSGAGYWPKLQPLTICVGSQYRAQTAETLELSHFHIEHIETCRKLIHYHICFYHVPIFSLFCEGCMEAAIKTGLSAQVSQLSVPNSDCSSSCNRLIELVACSRSWLWWQHLL